MFRKIFLLACAWVAALVLMGSGKIPSNVGKFILVAPAVLTLFFAYGPIRKKIGCDMGQGLILTVSIFCEVGIFIGGWVILRFFNLSLFFSGMIWIGAVFTAVIVGFLLCYFWWAPNNLFFTFVAEGQAKCVVRGDAFKKVVFQWKNHRLASTAEDGVFVGDIIEGSSPKTDSLLGRIKGFLGGFRFYGFWPFENIFLYTFKWTGVEQNGEVKGHEKKLDYVILKDDVYLLTVLGAECKNLLYVDISVVLTVRVVNPYKALFCVQSWLEMVINRIRPAVRDKISEKTFESWIKGKKDLADLIMRDPETEELLKEFRERYGLEVRAIEVIEINPGQEYRKATLQEFLAEREAERIRTVYGQIKKEGETGRIVRILEALEKSTGEGSRTILLPGIMDEVFNVFRPRFSKGSTLEEGGSEKN